MCYGKEAPAVIIPSLAVILFAGGTCLFAYAAMFYRVWVDVVPSNVQRNNYRRACWYLLNYFLSYTGIFVLYVIPALRKFDWLIVLALFLQYLSGFFNTLVYGLQSRYAKQYVFMQQE